MVVSTNACECCEPFLDYVARYYEFSFEVHYPQGVLRFPSVSDPQWDVSRVGNRNALAWTYWDFQTVCFETRIFNFFSSLLYISNQRRCLGIHAGNLIFALLCLSKKVSNFVMNLPSMYYIWNRELIYLASKPTRMLRSLIRPATQACRWLDYICKPSLYPFKQQLHSNLDYLETSPVLKELLLLTQVPEALLYLLDWWLIWPLGKSKYLAFLYSPSTSYSKSLTAHCISILSKCRLHLSPSLPNILAVLTPL